MKRIQQKHEYGCAIACLAMILEKDYDDIVKDFATNFNADGMSTEISIQYIIDNSCYGVVIHDFNRIRRYKAISKDLYKPFADAHLVKVKTRADQVSTAHLIVMDSKGKLYDSDHDGVKSLDEYYDVWMIVGIFK